MTSRSERTSIYKTPTNLLRLPQPTEWRAISPILEVQWVPTYDSHCWHLMTRDRRTKILWGNGGEP